MHCTKSKLFRKQELTFGYNWVISGCWEVDIHFGLLLIYFICTVQSFVNIENWIFINWPLCYQNSSIQNKNKWEVLLFSWSNRVYGIIQLNLEMFFFWNTRNCYCRLTSNRGLFLTISKSISITIFESVRRYCLRQISQIIWRTFWTMMQHLSFVVTY